MDSTRFAMGKVRAPEPLGPLTLASYHQATELGLLSSLSKAEAGTEPISPKERDRGQEDSGLKHSLWSAASSLPLYLIFEVKV